MVTWRKFEEPECWRKARQSTREVYRSTKGRAFCGDPGLRDQMRRASVSAMANIAEGHDRGGTSEFRQFLSQAKGSAAEVSSRLYVALDQGYVSHAEFDALQGLSETVGRLIGGVLRYLESCGIRGSKYRPSPRNSKLETRNR